VRSAPGNPQIWLHRHWRLGSCRSTDRVRRVWLGDQGRTHADWATFFSAYCWALTFAHRARWAAAIFRRAALLMRRAGLEAREGLAFDLGFILPCAQRCFVSRDIFLRAAALMRPGLGAFRAAFGGRPTLRCPVELTASIAEMASSIRSRSARSSARMLLVSMMPPGTGILTVDVETSQWNLQSLGFGGELATA